MAKVALRITGPLRAQKQHPADRRRRPPHEHQHRSSSAPAADKRQINDNRHANLSMLSTQRGSKNWLAQRAGTSDSRISLMTSARKPVSAPFASAIEDGLRLPRGWLDQPRTMASVPASVWHRLRPGSTALAPLAAGRGPTAMPEAHGHETVAGSSVDAPIRHAVIATPPVTPSKAATATVLIATGRFDKQIGQCGPIAEALAKTILNLSAADKLSEARAFQLLGNAARRGRPRVLSGPKLLRQGVSAAIRRPTPLVQGTCRCAPLQALV